MLIKTKLAPNLPWSPKSIGSGGYFYLLSSPIPAQTVDLSKPEDLGSLTWRHVQGLPLDHNRLFEGFYFKGEINRGEAFVAGQFSYFRGELVTFWVFVLFDICIGLPGGLGCADRKELNRWKHKERVAYLSTQKEAPQLIIWSKNGTSPPTRYHSGKGCLVSYP